MSTNSETRWWSVLFARTFGGIALGALTVEMMMLTLGV